MYACLIICVFDAVVCVYVLSYGMACTEWDGIGWYCTASPGMGRVVCIHPCRPAFVYAYYCKCV